LRKITNIIVNLIRKGGEEMSERRKRGGGTKKGERNRGKGGGGDPTDQLCLPTSEPWRRHCM